jgi:hypothetical protein
MHYKKLVCYCCLSGCETDFSERPCGAGVLPHPADKLRSFSVFAQESALARVAAGSGHLPVRCRAGQGTQELRRWGNYSAGGVLSIDITFSSTITECRARCLKTSTLLIKFRQVTSQVPTYRTPLFPFANVHVQYMRSPESHRGACCRDGVPKFDRRETFMTHQSYKNTTKRVMLYTVTATNRL